jgi:mevalonate kinase
MSVETLTRINEWAYLGERCIHRNPSGVDNTVATFGGGVAFCKERPEWRMTNGQFRPHKPAEKVIIKWDPQVVILANFLSEFQHYSFS